MLWGKPCIISVTCVKLAYAKRIAALALISSKLDYYCNTLCHNMQEKDSIARLQSVQNCLSRVVTKALRFSLSVPILKQLHWLHVKFRIHFKICTVSFRTQKASQPAYLADLLVRLKGSKYLRSTYSNKFVVTGIKNQDWAPLQHHSRSDIAHLHMRIVEIKQVGQSARILSIHVKEGIKREKSTSLFHFRKRQELGHEKSEK